jgi:molybdenum cofactor cytidylyltransferase
MWHDADVGREFEIAGIVLAAGRSSRMGRSKALLPAIGGDTFVTAVVRTLRQGGILDVLVVGRPEDHELREEVGRIHPAVTYVENKNADRGQLSSLLEGLDAAETRGAGAVIVMPVDIPRVLPETVANLVRAFRRSDAPIARVTHAARHGHPVIFRASVFDDLRAADMAAGAKAVLHAHADRILDVETDDPGVLRDVDVPEDYVRLFGHVP